MSTFGLPMRHLMALIQPSSRLRPSQAQPLYNPHKTFVQSLSSPHPACIQPSSNARPACIQPTSNPYPTVIQTSSNPLPACVPLPSWLILAVLGLGGPRVVLSFRGQEPCCGREKDPQGPPLQAPRHVTPRPRDPVLTDHSTLLP